MTKTELRQRRRQAEMTQGELARRMGVSPTTVSRWERGTRRLPQWAQVLFTYVEADARKARQDLIYRLSGITPYQK